VFAGRFKAVVIQDEPRVIEVARYVHLNPVRVGELLNHAVAVSMRGCGSQEASSRQAVAFF
jgi:hypothetical protein